MPELEMPEGFGEAVAGRDWDEAVLRLRTEIETAVTGTAAALRTQIANYRQAGIVFAPQAFSEIVANAS
ncbi:hypothetical protein AK812_SmicGene8585 [Symbiodinium microadriaticum]|uniref:Uncharacterized protein n=1 Tax=Symbiodinium microadriaticum TaxID=2951 RepID=A0A1Q9EKI7_SYMMI|nr:hypothetical protein AK812_SmicGene8585 [Symbiodinium microadriaticum]